MKKKNVIIVAGCIVAVAIVAVVLSQLVNWNVDRDKTSGDIAKTQRFSRQDTEPISNMQELLQNDTSYRNALVLSYVVMQTRAQQFSDLVEMSGQTVGDIKEFADVLAKMDAVREMTGNVCEQMKKAGDDLDAVLGGEDRPEVEQNVIDAALAYTTLQKQNQLANSFIETADSYLKRNAGSDQLKMVRDAWMDYQQMTAALNDDSKAAEALQKRGYLLTPEQNLAAMANDNVTHRVHRVRFLATELAIFFGVPQSIANVADGDLVHFRNSEVLGILNSSEVLAILGNPEALAIWGNPDALAGVRNTELLGANIVLCCGQTLGSIRPIIAALDTQEGMAAMSMVRIYILDVIVATSMGIRFLNNPELAAII